MVGLKKRSPQRERLYKNYGDSVLAALSKMYKKGVRFHASDSVENITDLIHLSEATRYEIVRSVCAQLVVDKKLNKQGTFFYFD